MANFHLSGKTISRKCRSSCAAAAYSAAQKIKDERTGITYDFTRKGGVRYSEIVVPAGSPTWAANRSQLWNHAELAEEKSTRRATATTAREFIIALPYELDSDAQLASAREFALYLVSTYGVAVDFSIHEPSMEGDKRNWHVHFLLTDRRMTDAGFAGKVRELNIANGGRAQISAIREHWAGIANRHLARAGSLERVDHRSYKSQCVEREPTKHLGAAANALERQGEKTERGNFNRTAAEINAIRAEIKALATEVVLQHEAEGLEAAHIPQLATNEKDGVATEKDTDKATSEGCINPANMSWRTTDQYRKVDALMDQSKLDHQKATETLKISATKMTHEERIKEAVAKAKIKREQRLLLERDHPTLGRGR